MVAAVEADFGAIGILVHNAGIASRGMSVVDTDPAELARVIATHALGPHYLSKLAIPGHADARPGRRDHDLERRYPRACPQTAPPTTWARRRSKRLAVTLSHEERDNGIRVNVVAPGLVETEMGRRLVKATAGVTDMRALDEASPFGRVCQPEDVANVVLFLVSEQNTYVTGQKIYCDGGGPG